MDEVAQQIAQEVQRAGTQAGCIIIRGATRLTDKVMQKCIQDILKGRALHTGEQSLSQLKRHGAKLEQLDINRADIKAFERIARREHFDFAIKKDVGSKNPTYYVFFKSHDADEVQKAFREYAKLKLVEKPSLLANLKKCLEKVASVQHSLTKSITIPKGPSL